MNIAINGKNQILENQITVTALLEAKGIKPQAVVVELNGEILERDTYQSTQINNGDTVEIVHFIGGG